MFLHLSYGFMLLLFVLVDMLGSNHCDARIAIATAGLTVPSAFGMFTIRSLNSSAFKRRDRYQLIDCAGYGRALLWYIHGSC